MKKFLIILLSVFIILIIAALVFLGVTFLIKQGKIFLPPKASGDFPPASLGDFPPAPQFLKIGQYYFSTALLLKKISATGIPAVFAILCKKGEDYDTIYIGETSGRESLTADEDSKCWLESCAKNPDNIYVAISAAPTTSETIKEELIKELSPVCSPFENNQ